MKPRLPFFLRMALFCALALTASQIRTYAETVSLSDWAQFNLLSSYTSPDILHQNQSVSYKRITNNDPQWTCENTQSVRFLNNTASVLYTDWGTSFFFKNNGSIIFSDNTLTTGSGAGIAMRPDYYVNESSTASFLEFTGNETVSFKNNKALAGNGGAILNTMGGDKNTSAGGVIFRGNGEVSFSGNEARIGGAVYTFKDVFFESNTAVRFLNNKASAGVAAIYSNREVRFSGNGSVDISGNETPGALTGAIYTQRKFTLTGNTGATTIAGNRNLGGGGAKAAGAIYIDRPVSIDFNSPLSFGLEIAGNGTVDITDNYSKTGSGALYLNLIPTGTNLISADGGDITFRNNISGEWGRLGLLVQFDSIWETRMDFRATDGRALNFYDAFRFTAADSSCMGEVFTLDLNKEEGYTGNILISGADNEGQPLTSWIEGNVNLHRGQLTVTDKAVLHLAHGNTGDVPDSGNFNAVGKAILEITNGGVMEAERMTLQGDTVLRAGGGASVTVGTLDLGKGMTFDLSPFLDSKNSGLNVSAGNWVLGDDIILSSLDFEGDTRWEKDQKFLLLNDADSTHGEQDFYRILVEGTNSNIVQTGSAFSGQWTYVWEDGNLYAVWSTEIREGAELWWDGEGDGMGDGDGVWNQTASNKVWNKDSSDGDDWEFADLDVIHFWKGGNTQIEGNVSVQGKVKPLGVIDVMFNEDKGVLTWWGDGSIVGSGTSLEKRGTGTLIIRTGNTYGGGTSLYGGVLQIETRTGLGTGLVTIYGGYLNLGEKGVVNTIEVVGRGSLSGISEGSVSVLDKGELILQAGTSYTAGPNSADPLKKSIQVFDEGHVFVQAGAVIHSGIRLDNANTTLTLASGNGGTSILDGAIEGSGTIKIQGGSHWLQNIQIGNDRKFTGETHQEGGEFTVSVQMGFGSVHMTGGTFIADNKITLSSLMVGSGSAELSAREEALIKALDSTFHHDVLLEIGDMEIRKNATLHASGTLYAKGITGIREGGILSIGRNSTFISTGQVTARPATDTLDSGRIQMESGSAWNANGGFDLSYFDGRAGILTIGSDSILRENGFFASEQDVRGTDSTGKLLPSFTPAEYLPTLIICRGATLWTGTTTKSGQGEYTTQTGFYNVTLDIDALVTIGTFVTRGSGDGIISHEGLVDSMLRAFTPKLENGEDLRNYAYILQDGINYDSLNITVKSNEAIYVESGANARVRATSGAIFNEGGFLRVDQINETGSVTISGGRTDLTSATPNQETFLFIGSFGAQSTVTTAAQIKLDESATIAAFVEVGTVQAQTGEKTVIVKDMQVNAVNFIIAGSDTLVDNQGGALTVEREVTLTDSASYNVGDKDRFGWINMNGGNVTLTDSSWTGITLGSYAVSSDETAARIRLNETQENKVEANELHIVAGEDQTLVNAGTSVGANKLFVDQGAHLNVNGGELNVREALIYGKGVTQEGLIHLKLGTGSGAPSRVLVSLAGDNHIGHINSSTSSGAFVNRGFNQMEGYANDGKDIWTFVLTDAMLDSQNELNALVKIANQSGNTLEKIILDTRNLTKSYTGDIQLYSGNITLDTDSVDYGEATGTYNRKDAVKNFRYVNPLVPEVGDITVNSLWTMTSAMDTLASAVMGQLDCSPYRQYLARNIWAKGLYMNENIGKALPGYRKDSGGYAVGADTKIGEKSLIGVSFARMLGTEMTNRHMAEVDQNILMAALYGRHQMGTDVQNPTALDFMAGYGRADNDGTFYKNGSASYGDWKSNVYNAKMRLTWYRKVNERVNINPYAGGEFVFAEHEAHSIKGAAGDMDVSRSRMHALRLPIGATVEYKTTESVTNYIGASYVPDVIRQNPSATVTNGMLSLHAADSSVGRHAMRAYTGCSWQINKQWFVNLNYELEVASEKVNHRANLTTSYSF